jgi:hypothetical protein
MGNEKHKTRFNLADVACDQLNLFDDSETLLATRGKIVAEKEKPRALHFWRDSGLVFLNLLIQTMVTFV